MDLYINDKYKKIGSKNYKIRLFIRIRNKMIKGIDKRQ